MALDETGQGQLHLSRQVGSRAWPGAKRRGDQVGIRCVFMRGGTSRGAFLHAADLPDDLALREQLLLGMYGSPDIRQIDGLGGAHPLTSKVAIVGRSSRPNADIDFTFRLPRSRRPTREGGTSAPARSRVKHGRAPSSLRSYGGSVHSRGSSVTRHARPGGSATRPCPAYMSPYWPPLGGALRRCDHRMESRTAQACPSGA